MFNIAICDSDALACQKLEKYACMAEDICVEVFYSGCRLCEKMNEGKYFDLVFLCVEMEEMNGIKVGERIREEFKNESTSIIYVAKDAGYAMKLFATRPFEFLVKPIKPARITEVVKKAKQIMQNSDEYFEFQINKTFYKLFAKDIVCFESRGRNVIIYTTKENYTIYNRLCNIEDKLNKWFVRVHQSYLINKRYIKVFKCNELFLMCGRRIPISATYRSHAKRAILDKQR